MKGSRKRRRSGPPYKHSKASAKALDPIIDASMNKRMGKLAPVDAIIAERTKVYGDPYLSHQCIGLAFTALIQQHYQMPLDHPVPASLVARMMLALKNQRASLVYHEDNFRDGEAYLRFAEQFQSKEAPGASPSRAKIHGLSPDFFEPK